MCRPISPERAVPGVNTPNTRTHPGRAVAAGFVIDPRRGGRQWLSRSPPPDLAYRPREPPPPPPSPLRTARTNGKRGMERRGRRERRGTRSEDWDWLLISWLGGIVISAASARVIPSPERFQLWLRSAQTSTLELQGRCRSAHSDHQPGHGHCPSAQNDCQPAHDHSRSAHNECQPAQAHSRPAHDDYAPAHGSRPIDKVGATRPSRPKLDLLLWSGHTTGLVGVRMSWERPACLNGIPQPERQGRGTLYSQSHLPKNARGSYRKLP